MPIKIIEYTYHNSDNDRYARLVVGLVTDKCSVEMWNLGDSNSEYFFANSKEEAEKKAKEFLEGK